MSTTSRRSSDGLSGSNHQTRHAAAVLNTAAQAASSFKVGSHLSVRPPSFPAPRARAADATLDELAPKKRTKPTALDLGPAAANIVVKAKTAHGDVVVKTRVAPNDPIDEELWALAHSPESVAPPLLFAASHEVLSAMAVANRAFDDAAALEIYPTHSLVMKMVPGKPPSGEETRDLENTAVAIGRLHRVAPRKGPPMRAGRSLIGGIRLCGHLLQRLARDNVVNAKQAKEIERRLRTWRESADALPRRSSPVLCHGDLRLHNVLVTKTSATLIDFEHAGLSDPALDIALFRARTPLTENAELTFLDAYLDDRWKPGHKEERFFLDRYALARTIALGLAGLAGAHDVLEVVLGQRRTGVDISEYVDDKRRACAEDLSEAFAKPISPRGHRPTKPTAKRASTLAIDPKFPPPKSLSKRSSGVRRRQLAIAIDGTSASGKSVLAKAAAEVHRLRWSNTGALFRLLALRALECDLALTPDAPKANDRSVDLLLKSFRGHPPKLTDDGAVVIGSTRYELALETIEVERTVALWAREPKVRAFVGPSLAAAVERGGVVEGRAITSELWPDAPHRFFVDATLACRAKRVHKRLWQPPPLAKLTRDLDARDTADRTRTLAPLVLTRGVVAIDTTKQTLGGSVDRFLSRLERATPRHARSRPTQVGAKHERGVDVPAHSTLGRFVLRRWRYCSRPRDLCELAQARRSSV